MPPRPKRRAAEVAETKAKRARGEMEPRKFDLEWGTGGDLLAKGGDTHPLLVLSSDTQPGRTKAAGFDIDGTLITTKSGRKFATGAKDWKWLYPSVPDTLRELHRDGHRVIFFTNQAGIEKMKVSPQEIMIKIDAMVEDLDIPAYAFVATGNNHFRKPSTEMWKYFEENCNGGVPVDREKSVFVGDAAGRAKEWAPGKPRDFSCSDRMFAANLGVEFKTPEEFFLDEPKAKFAWGAIDPGKLLKDAPEANKKAEYHSNKKEVVLMVGPPASGKSTFSAKYLKPHGYLIVNRDTLGTPAKCIKAAKEALKAGKSVVIDNTNPAPHVRADFIEIAEDEGVPCRCIWLQTPMELAHHLNLVRQNQTSGKVRRIPDVGYNVFKKNFEDPQKSEGFTEILKVDFVPQFNSKRDEELFREWTSSGGH